MFRQTAVFCYFRFFGSVAMLAAVGVLLLTGCRLPQNRKPVNAIDDSPPITNSQPIPNVQTVAPQTVRGAAPPETVTAYRPPMPMITTVSPKETAPTIPTAKTEIIKVETLKPNPETEKLNKRIAELEKQLAEAKRANETKAVPPPVPVKEPAATLKLPVLNIPGVSLSSDEKHIRIVVPDSVLFTAAPDKFNPAAEETLRKIAGEIRAGNPSASLEIEGHTDRKSTDPANATQSYDVSSAKALAVMDYFVKSLRWEPAKIKTSSFGASKPIADSGTAERRSKNDRIEIVITPV
ncbi:MAG: OmpA family protein [Planctomycetaceae bacterium]|jgi:flagellar motor protein MotB|nr:OmpA family protein [Planctomycetaceae bacterium]